MTIAPTNEWPDPTFCIQDSGGYFTSMNDAATGTIGGLTITGYSVGSRNVTVYTSNTAELNPGNLVHFGTAADTALKQYFLRIISVNPNTSFTVETEYVSGAPTTSNPCTATVVQRGAFNTGSGNVTSNVQRYADGTIYPNVWISDRAAHTSLLHGCKRVLIVQKVTDNLETIYWESPTSRLSCLGNTKRSVGFAAYVVNGSGAQAEAYFNVNGTVSSGGSGTATAASRTWISGITTIPASPTYYYAGVQLTGPTGSTFILGEFTECPSTIVLGDGLFSTPRSQFIRFLASVSPWAGISIPMPASGNFTLDMQQTSNGVINGGVSILTGLLEGQAPTVGDSMSTSTSASAPALYNPILHQPATGAAGNPMYYAFCGGNFNVGDSTIAGVSAYTYPTMYVYGTASITWQYVSWDLHGAILFVGP
jgi:hypothetical protein